MSKGPILIAETPFVTKKPCTCIAPYRDLLQSALDTWNRSGDGVIDEPISGSEMVDWFTTVFVPQARDVLGLAPLQSKPPLAALTERLQRDPAYHAELLRLKAANHAETDATLALVLLEAADVLDGTAAWKARFPDYRFEVFQTFTGLWHAVAWKDAADEVSGQPSADRATALASLINAVTTYEATAA